MPNRVIRDGILRSDKVNILSWAAETFYRRLMSVADDFGRFDGRPSIIRSSIYPLRLDKVSESDISKWMDECSKAGLVSLYEVKNKPYLEILDFGQTIRIKKQKYPPAIHMQADVSRCDTDVCLKPNQSETNPKPDLDSKENKIQVTQFFIDLVNGSQIVEISRLHKIDLATLQIRVQEFKQHSRLEYKDYGDFVFHFKNWLNKPMETPVINSPTVKLGTR